MQQQSSNDDDDDDDDDESGNDGHSWWLTLSEAEQLRSKTNDDQKIQKENENGPMDDPFCVQIVDALRAISSTEELQDIVHEINFTQMNNNGTIMAQ